MPLIKAGLVSIKSREGEGQIIRHYWYRFVTYAFFSIVLCDRRSYNCIHRFTDLGSNDLGSNATGSNDKA